MNVPEVGLVLVAGVEEKAELHQVRAPRLAEVVVHLNRGVAIEERARAVVASAQNLAVRSLAGAEIELHHRNCVELHRVGEEHREIGQPSRVPAALSDISSN